MSVVPYKSHEGSKKEQVAEMFDNISPKYDLLNRLLSMGIDISWRKKALSFLKDKKPKTILDVATGTGDLALEAWRMLGPDKIVGADISAGMLEVGRKKIAGKNLSDKIEMKLADSESLPFADAHFDAVTAAFGVRNFQNLEKGLAEMFRVLKPGGHILILEFSQPESFPFKQIYNFYFKNVLPGIGRLISKDGSAYTYLPESVSAFPFGSEFTGILSKIGFSSPLCRPLTFGISSIYFAQKPTEAGQ